ncbi:MAG: hypothetical protein JWO09_1929 [Bacteroidetes bacterium]|nr:hypothetical protein [Bacteroidota bacterium]
MKPGLKNNSLNKSDAYTYCYYAALLLIIIISVLFYAPCNYAFYNSDNAIHVLMAKDFQLPRDYYYWGQRRLGSLLPMLASLMGKLIPLHYLYICSIVQYAFLLTGFAFLASLLKSRVLKVALCAVILLPVNAFNYLILIGHPYAAQLFTGCLFIYSCALLKRYLLANARFGMREMILALLISGMAILFFLAGVWVSEFNAVLMLIPAVHVLFEKQLRARILAGLRNVYFIVFSAASFFLLAGGYLLYKRLTISAVADSVYDKVFIDNKEDLAHNVSLFLEKAGATLLFKDGLFYQDLFYWFLIVVSVMIFILMRGKLRKTVFNNSLLLVCIVSTVALFFSTWNLKGNFSPRYFVPVYIVFCLSLLLFLDAPEHRKWFRNIVAAAFVFFGCRYCYDEVISRHLPGPFEQCGEYAKLPKGTLFGDYWEVYKINSVAIDNLQALPFETLSVRNWDWKEIPLAETNFYFLNNNSILPGGLRDTIMQYGLLFKYSGKKYKCNGTEVLQYHKLQRDLLSEFYIRSSGNKYVSINPETRVLRADRPDTVGAARFYVINARSGNSIKASNGMFVCADLGQNGNISAKSEHAWDWEMFRFISLGRTKFQLLAVSDKYISADSTKGNILIADKEKPQAGETFDLVPE